MSKIGLPLYQFRYLGGTVTYEGVMAQDVLMQRPDAVHMLGNGFMAVDCEALGIEMKVIR